MIVQLLDVLIGLSVVFLIFSTVASTLLELVESRIRKRGVLLEAGIREMFARVLKADAAVMDPNVVDRLVARLYMSPYLYPLFKGEYRPGGRNLPSYIPAERFAGAVLALADQPGPDDETELAFRKIREIIVQLGGGGITHTAEETKALVIRYFDESMDRVSGWYRRYARWCLFGLGFLLAGLFNIDTIELTRVLSQDDVMRQEIVFSAMQDIDQWSPGRAADGGDAAAEKTPIARVEERLRLSQTLGLPVGWTESAWDRLKALPKPGEAYALAAIGNVMLWSKVLGVLLTAVALSFGAPFWFDLLNKLTELRSALKPERDKQRAEEPPPAKKKAAAPPAPVIAPSPPRHDATTPAADDAAHSPTGSA